MGIISSVEKQIHQHLIMMIIQSWTYLTQVNDVVKNILGGLSLDFSITHSRYPSLSSVINIPNNYGWCQGRNQKAVNLRNVINVHSNTQINRHIIGLSRCVQHAKGLWQQFICTLLIFLFHCQVTDVQLSQHGTAIQHITATSPAGMTGGSSAKLQIIHSSQQVSHVSAAKLAGIYYQIESHQHLHEKPISELKTLFTIISIVLTFASGL